jgi:hypothetical protein
VAAAFTKTVNRNSFALNTISVKVIQKKKSNYPAIQSQCAVITPPAGLKATQGLNGGRLNAME